MNIVIWLESMKRIRYSLRSMLILFALVSVCLGSLGFYARKSQLQREMVAQLNSLGKEGSSIWVQYDTWLKWNSELGQYETDFSRIDKSGNFRLTGLKGWIHSKQGVDFIDRPVIVNIQYEHTEKLPQISNEMLELVRKLEIEEIRVHKVYQVRVSSSIYPRDMIRLSNVVTQDELELVTAQFPSLRVSKSDGDSYLPTR